MKNKILMLSLLFISLMACSNDDEKEQSQEELDLTVANLQGSWLAVEYGEHSGSEFEPFRSIDDSNQYTYTFKNDLSFLNTSTPQCGGIYEIDQENKQLILNFEDSCDANPSFSTVFLLTYYELILTRSAGDEAVKIKYKKLQN